MGERNEGPVCLRPPAMQQQQAKAENHKHAGKPNSHETRPVDDGQPRVAASKLMDVNLKDFPDKSLLTHRERIVTASVCLSRAIRSLPPAYCPPGKLFFFRIVNNNRYIRALLLVALTHAIIVTFWEPPPRLYGASAERIAAAGYSTSFVYWFDIIACQMYLFHVFLLWYLTPSGNWYRNLDKPFCLVTTFIYIDMLLDVARESYGLRPFRFLRPLLYVLLSPQSRNMAKSTLATIVPVVKAVLLLLLFQIFWCVVGLNVFEGSASDTNPFGAACWTEAGETHPFQNFGQAFVSMYVLATAANHPDIVWPFYTCNCTFRASNLTGIMLPDYKFETSKWCGPRRAFAGVFFVSYMLVVFFSLFKCILAICFYYFDKGSKHQVLKAVVRQRVSIITAFHYLAEGDGDTARIAEAMFQEAYIEVQHLNPFTKQNAATVFRLLDEEKKGQLSLKNMFKFPDVLATSFTLRRHKDLFGCYSTWKKSKPRQQLLALVRPRFGKMSYLESFVLVLLFLDFFLLAVESARNTAGAHAFSQTIVVVVVIEAFLRAIGLGIHSYMLEKWNVFDAFIALFSFVVLIVEISVNKPEYDSVFKLLNTFKVFRLLKVLSFSSRSLEAKEVKDEAPERFAFLRKLMDALVRTVPASINIALLLALSLVFFSLICMELLAKIDANTKTYSTNKGGIDYTGGDVLQYDWSDMPNSLWSTMTILAQNIWHQVLFNAIKEVGFHVAWLLVLIHFTTNLILANVLQSVFINIFQTLFDREVTERTKNKPKKNRLACVDLFSAVGGFERM
eukprot:c20125_g1_i1.p1 GENE.c20125_g1_i1~~c20125_g1_i1.p1  ORF type:complete len:789 (+),score=191.05 c20125_g1_i1:2-2368(+)